MPANAPLVGDVGAADSTDELERRGYAVLRSTVPGDARDTALRRLNLELVWSGLDPRTVGDWARSAHWFPHLKWDAAIVDLVAWLPESLRDGELCDPQIVLQPPDNCEDMPLTPHCDEEPAWAHGRRYRHIVGVALTRSCQANGGLVVWPFGGRCEAVELDPGDIVVMHPQLPHTSGLNRAGDIRCAVYFRFLESAA